MPRTKMTRHELKEQDEITTSLQKFTELVLRYKKEVTTGVSVAAALAIIIFGWSYYRSSRTAKAEAGRQCSCARSNARAPNDSIDFIRLFAIYGQNYPTLRFAL